MRTATLLRRLGRYGAVGAVAAGVHLAVLISLEMVIPSWLANPLAFLAASVLIGTGDQFIGDAAVIAALHDALPNLQAVEMEGAAVAQVAEQENVPWLVLRVISDGADSEAAQSFNDFVQAYDARAWTLIETLLRRQASAPRR